VHVHSGRVYGAPRIQVVQWGYRGVTISVTIVMSARSMHTGQQHAVQGGLSRCGTDQELCQLALPASWTSSCHPGPSPSPMTPGASSDPPISNDWKDKSSGACWSSCMFVHPCSHCMPRHHTAFVILAHAQAPATQCCTRPRRSLLRRRPDGQLAAQTLSELIRAHPSS